MKKHIYICDYMRAIAALAVVLFHYTTRYDELFGHSGDCFIAVPWGYMGVAVFFMLSGFLTAMTINERITPKRWIVSRFIRLYPLYWIAAIFTFIVTGAFLRERAVTWEQFLINLTMGQDFLGVASVDGAYWTLRYELTFYAFVLLLILFKQTNRLKVGMWMWVIAAVAVDLIGKFVPVLKTVSNLMLVQYVAVIAIGVTLGDMLKKRQKWDYLMLPVLLGIFLKYNGITYTAVVALLTAVFLLSVFVSRIQFWRAPAPVHNVLTFLAGISYPMYLIHQNNGYAVIGALERYGTSSWIAVILTSILAVVAAVLMSTLDRRVFQPLLKKIINN